MSYTVIDVLQVVKNARKGMHDDTYDLLCAAIKQSPYGKLKRKKSRIRNLHTIVCIK